MNTYLLIDRSASMAGRWREVSGMVLAYSRDIAKDTKITLATFDSTFGGSLFEVVYDRILASQFTGIPANIAPRGGTPLFDAIGALSPLIEQHNPERATIMIVTDGEENQSMKYTKTSSTKIIEKWKNQGFDVTFVGADFKNVHDQAGSVGVDFRSTINYASHNFADVGKTLATRSMAYSKGVASASLSFSDAERAAAVA